MTPGKGIMGIFRQNEHLFKGFGSLGGSESCVGS
jgi:hypothetical protein